MWREQKIGLRTCRTHLVGMYTNMGFLAQDGSWSHEMNELAQGEGAQ